MTRSLEYFRPSSLTSARSEELTTTNVRKKGKIQLPGMTEPAFAGEIAKDPKQAESVLQTVVTVYTRLYEKTCGPEIAAAQAQRLGWHAADITERLKTPGEIKRARQEATALIKRGAEVYKAIQQIPQRNTTSTTIFENK